ncbi:uncharacterized protein [Chelonus insularis]|uniref:uncharacterized protein n=1 Tax=Chelonus insularis TaxID=460826 RepID=UPI00158AE0E5|nr:uncharacterized protein LOC118073150 [Chelonus insularis]
MKTMGDVVADVAEEEGCIHENDQNVFVGKELSQRTFKSLKRGLGRLWRRHRGNVSITEYDPCYKVAYLGNVLTGWAKGEDCIEKPVSTLWRNYVSSSRPDVTMRLTITNGGLTASTKDHGLTEYWAHRVTYCAAPASHPRLFVWVYRHEGRRLKPELRCHAALCSKESTAKRLASILNTRLHQALVEFRRDKVSRQNARLSLANAVYENPSLPRRKILLSTGGQNYRPPLERSKSAPKLSSIEEDSVAEEIEQKRLLEELRSLENVARSWKDQDGWRLARLVDALNRAGAASSSDYLDENASISSGCETASTSNSEERTLISDDNHLMNTGSNELRNNSRRVLFSNSIILSSSNPKLSRNSECPDNFILYNENTAYSCKRIGRYTSSNSENDNLMENEESNAHQSTNVFDFEDNQIFHEIVDYRPHGESPIRIENTTGRRMEVKGEKYPSCVDQLFQNEHERSEQEDTEGEKNEHTELRFITLDSLDEEEADSDESGYVEAPPSKVVLLNQRDNSDFTNKTRLKPNDDISDSINNQSCDQYEFENLARFKDREKVDFIKCPISETIKKLANASLKSSKSLEISTSNCLKALNTFTNSKSFDSIETIKCEDESPSLYQRKQLLAQQGVTV